MGFFLLEFLWKPTIFLSLLQPKPHAKDAHFCSRSGHVFKTCSKQHKILMFYGRAEQWAPNIPFEMKWIILHFNLFRFALMQQQLAYAVYRNRVARIFTGFSVHIVWQWAPLFKQQTFIQCREINWFFLSLPSSLDVTWKQLVHNCRRKKICIYTLPIVGAALNSHLITFCVPTAILRTVSIWTNTLTSRKNRIQANK